MTLSVNRRLLASVLATLLAVSAFAQEQQAPTDQAPPETNAPQPANPQNVAPGSESQTTPPPSQEQPAAPKETPTPQQQPPPSTSEPPRPESTVKTPAKPKSTKSRKRKKPISAPSTANARPSNHAPATSGGQSGKVVVRNGGVKDDAIQLSPGGTQEQALHSRENTAQLLATTDENLKRMAGRQLTPSEQDTLDQIHSYVRQAKSAADAGDLTRAHTLAFKAHLLSDDLAKR